MKGKVYLVGAGCGDADLITVRGMNILRRCDVLVYDSLIDKRLLEYAPENSEKIYVGKRSGYHTETQENINKILVRKALEGKITVRLKGGDPFVFGHGGEEITALKKYNIPYSIIPGISSCIAIPELAGIPVTHRRISRSFHVITGHPLPENLEYYAESDGTLVFLMGLNNLSKIADGLIAGGMPADTPCAVISGNHKVTGSLDCIADTAEHENIHTPAVTVIGKTAEFDFRPDIKNISITVTGTKRFTGKLYSKLSALDIQTEILDYLKITEYKDNPDFDNALRNTDKYDMIVLTSINGTEIFFSRIKKLGIDIRRFGNLKFAVIGENTAEILREHGIYPDIIPEIYKSSELAEAIAKSNPNKVLILRSEKGSKALTDILYKNHIPYDDIKTYDIECYPDKTKVNSDFLVFGSESGVKSFFDSGYEVSDSTKIICIGETTAEAVPEYLNNIILTAENHDIQGIINTILKEINLK